MEKILLSVNIKDFISFKNFKEVDNIDELDIKSKTPLLVCEKSFKNNQYSKKNGISQKK